MKTFEGLKDSASQYAGFLDPSCGWVVLKWENTEIGD